MYRRRGHAYVINRNRPRGIKARAFEKLKRVYCDSSTPPLCAAPNIARSPSPPPPLRFLPARERDYLEKFTRIVCPVRLPSARIHAPLNGTRSCRLKSIYNVCTFTCHAIGQTLRVRGRAGKRMKIKYTVSEEKHDCEHLSVDT